MRRIRWWSASILAAIALFLGTMPASLASDMPSKRYRDPNAKFSFRIFDDWDPVPLEAEGKGFRFGGDTDKFLVIKYMQKGAEKRGLEGCQLQAFRMGKGTAGQGGSGETTTSDGGDPFEKKMRELAKKDDPTTMKQLFDKLLENYGFTGFLDAKQAKPLKSKDDVVGSMWVVEKKNERMPSSYPPYLMVFASWKKGDMELGLWLYAPGESKRKFEQGFQAVAKSFMYFDAHAEDVKSLDVLKDLPISAKKKRQIERGLVKGWDVLVSPKKNYIIIYNTKGKRNTLLAKIIAERIEAIREQVYETRFPPSAKIEAISIVRICGDQGEYRAYGGPGGSAGYWSSDTEELVFYDASPAKAPDDDTLAVLYHEAFHQYIYYSVGKVAPHSWYNEGTGDYFAGAKYSGGKFSIRPFNWRIGTIQAAIRKGPCPCEETTDSDGDVHFKFDRTNEGYSPLKALVKMSQRDYYSYPGISYAQGWSFIYFLREAVPKNPAWNAKWGNILETYFKVLKEEVNKKHPLVPVKPPVEPPGMDAPGMDDPSTDDPGMDDPGTDEPGMGEPGMDDPGMGDSGMGDPGMGDSGMDDPPVEGAVPMPSFSSWGDDDAALKKAIEEAFKGVDFDELEKAWKESTLRVK